MAWLSGWSPARRKLAHQGQAGIAESTGNESHIRNWKHLPFMTDETCEKRVGLIERSQPASSLVTPELDATSTAGAAMCVIEAIYETLI